MGKYKKFFYFFIVVICFAFMPKVNAEVIASNSENASFGVTFKDVYDFPYSFTLSGNTDNAGLLTLYNYEGLTRPYTYLVASVCSNGPVNHWYLKNPSYNYYFQEDTFIAYNTGKSCPYSSYYGELYYIQMQVGQYEDADGTGEELIASSYFYMWNSYSYATFYRINNWYLSSDDFLTELKSNENLLNQMVEIENGLVDVTNGLNTVNSTLNGTNSRLDGINSSINQSNSLLQESNQKQQEMINKQNETNQKLDANTSAVNEQTNTMKDSNSSEATNEAGSFFSGFTTDTFGLTSIITAPLNLITSITSSTCSPVGLPIPFVDNMTLNLPCLRGIYEQHFGTLLSVYQTITFGIVAYWVCIRIFALVKDFKNPEHDEIEVLDL